MARRPSLDGGWSLAVHDPFAGATSALTSRMFLNGLHALDHRNMVAFFARAPTPIRSHIVEWVSRSVARDDLPDEWFARTQEFLEWREQCVREGGFSDGELRKVSWFVASGAFPVEWWARRLANALSASPDSFYDFFAPLDDVMAHVAAVSAEHPAMAVEVIESAIARNQGEWLSLYVASAEAILTRASEQPDLATRVRNVADETAKAGYGQLERFSSSPDRPTGRRRSARWRATECRPAVGSPDLLAIDKRPARCGPAGARAIVGTPKRRWREGRR